MRQRRNPRQIRADLEKVMENSNVATSLRQLAKMSNLSYSQLMTTLSKFPNLKQALTEMLKNNWLQEHYRLGYVVDASMASVSEQIILEIINSNNIVILLKQTISELDKVHKAIQGDLTKSKRAHILMDKAYYDRDHFVIVNYTKMNISYVDDIVIEYCKKNSNRVVLLTADKNMALKARGSFPVKYYAQSILLPPSTKRLDNGGLLINTKCEKNRYIRVITKDGTVHENEEKFIFLKEGDQVYTGVIFAGKIRFEHYEILDEIGGNNLIYKSEVGFSKKELNKISLQYKSFVEQCVKMQNKKS